MMQLVRHNCINAVVNVMPNSQNYLENFFHECEKQLLQSYVLCLEATPKVLQILVYLCNTVLVVYCILSC